MTRIFNKNSWHYRLATTYGNSNDFDVPKNICGYIRSVMFGMFIVLVVILVGAALVISLASPILFWGIEGWYMWDIGHHPEVVIGVCLYALILLFFGWFMWDTRISPYVHERFHLPQNTFVMTAWESIHNKTCFPIDFVDKTETTPTEE
jgi:disulfide bond formation protein DsbB